MISVPENKKSLIGIVRSEDTEAHLRAYCDSASDIVSEIKVNEPVPGSASGLINGGADIVVLEAGSSDSADLDELEKICTYVSSGGSFIVILENPTAEIMRRLFRAGVTDVLAAPAEENELYAALETARTRSVKSPSAASPPSPAQAGKIITVIKSAGGVGATTIATNLAATFNDFEVGEVALVDLDVQFGQIATSLDAHPRMSILDAIRAGHRLDATLLSSIMHDHASGVKILAAPTALTPLEAVTDTFITRLFENLRNAYAVSIVELPAAWTQSVGEALAQSDQIVIVVEPVVRCATGSARIAQAMSDFGLKSKNAFIVANKFEKTMENSARIKKIAEIFDAKPGGAVRFDEKAGGEAADRGMLLKDVSAKSIATKDIETNARRLAAVMGVTLGARTSGPQIGRFLGSIMDRRGAGA
jgi:pilus assembly protein CpaE